MKEQYDAANINKKLIWNFRDIGHTLRYAFDGKGSQQRILIMLRDLGRVTQSELTRMLDIQPGSASEVLGKLEASGLIARTQSEADRRTIDLHLTDAGLEAAEEAARQRDERHERMFACLSEEDKETLLSFLEQINNDWDVHYREKKCKDDWHMRHRAKKK